jgi:hypothetical protein
MTRISTFSLRLYLAALRGRGNLDEALAFLSRSGGEPPPAGDELDGSV